MPTTTMQPGFNTSSPNQSIFFSAIRLQKLVPKDVKEALLKASCKQYLRNKKLWFHFPNLVLFRSKKYCRHLLLLLTNRPTYNDFNATEMQKTHSILSIHWPTRHVFNTAHSDARPSVPFQRHFTVHMWPFPVAPVQSSPGMGMKLIYVMMWYFYDAMMYVNIWDNAPEDARSDFRSVTTSWAGPPATGQRGDMSFRSWMDIKPINIGMKWMTRLWTSVNKIKQDKISTSGFPNQWVSFQRCRKYC